jgi:hypothetical protein
MCLVGSARSTEAWLLPDAGVNFEFVEKAKQHSKFRGDVVRKALATTQAAHAKLDKEV